MLMKKLLLITCAVFVSAGLYAQKTLPKVKMDVKTYSAKLYDVAEEVPVQSPSIVNTQATNANRSANDITVVNLGSAANAYGLYNGGRSALWADPNINSVAFFHRMQIPPDGPGSGYIAHDLSTDGGVTWSLNNQFYDPTIAPGANARYPQGVLVNPVGNTDPNNAYAVNVNATTDQSNGETWGGIGAAFTKLDGTGLAQQSWPTIPPFRNNVPDAMTVNPVTGDVFVVDISTIGGIGSQYLDTLTITRGVVADNAIEWTQSLFYAPVNVYGTSLTDVRIAFAPDGMTGYICTLSDNGQDDFATESAYYPILYKTTDGGLTWDEDAIVVPLGGPDGLHGITYGLMDDAQWLEFWGDPVPDREEIIYTTAFTHDFAVDFNGNPVISVVIGVSGVHGTNATAYSILSSGGFIASYNIFSQDGGETWLAQKLGDNLLTFRGDFGVAPDDISEDNRSQLTTSLDGTKMFFSWLDTDFEGVTDNVQPDIYCIGWNAVTNMYTEVENVTFLSDAWLQAFMGTASYYALESEDGQEFTIPFVYQQMTVVNNAIDPLLPVQYKYIPDFKFTIMVGTERPLLTVASISQNYPNPANNATRVNVTLSKTAMVSLEVYNIVGQKVYEIPARNLTEGTHPFEINVADLKAGVYTYAVIANGERSTRKMMVN